MGSGSIMGAAVISSVRWDISGASRSHPQRSSDTLQPATLMPSGGRHRRKMNIFKPLQYGLPMTQVIPYPSLASQVRERLSDIVSVHATFRLQPSRGSYEGANLNHSSYHCSTLCRLPGTRWPRLLATPDPTCRDLFGVGGHDAELGDVHLELRLLLERRGAVMPPLVCSTSSTSRHTLPQSKIHSLYERDHMPPPTSYSPILLSAKDPYTLHDKQSRHPGANKSRTPRSPQQ